MKAAAEDSGHALIRDVLDAYDLPGTFGRHEPIGSGHINDTYRVQVTGRTQHLFVLQRLNTDVFRHPEKQIANIHAILPHLHDHAASPGRPAFRTVSIVPTRRGEPLLIHEGRTWRMMTHVENAYSVDVVRNAHHAYEAARAFGWFVASLRDLPPEKLHDIIPDFHNTPKRHQRLVSAIATDAHRRLATARAEADFALARREDCRLLEVARTDGTLPSRAVHNDTKVNNVMFDQQKHHAVSVIDLDTVMAGTSLYDFGDLARTSITLSREDDRDLSRIRIQPELFKALVNGYLESAGAILNDKEKAWMYDATRIITLEIGIRFLTDYLEGDHYFKCGRPGHNLDRARAQFKLVQELEANEPILRRIVDAAI